MSLFLPLLFAVPASAGERVFVFSYGYGTVPKGGIEVEHYATVGIPDGQGPGWEHQIELEYGITDRLEAGLYVVGQQGDAEPFHFAGYKARLRYRFGAQGVAPVDLAAYLEYAGAAELTSHELEAKLIAARQIGVFESALNLEYRVGFSGEGIEQAFEPTLGLGFHLVPAFLLGAEGKIEVETGLDAPLAWVGPTVHLAGEGGRLWWTVGVLLPLTEGTRTEDGVVARSLVGLNL